MNVYQTMDVAHVKEPARILMAHTNAIAVKVLNWMIMEELAKVSQI